MFFKTFMYGYVTVLISNNEIFSLSLGLDFFVCLTFLKVMIIIPGDTR